MKAKTIQHRKSEKGQSLVELGVVLIVMFIILAGIIDLGGMIFQFLAMRDSAQEGASYASIYPEACNQAIERVKTNLHNTDPSQIFVTITVDGVACHLATPANACASKEVQVVVSQPEYPVSMPFLGVFLGRQTIALEAKVADTIIRPPCP